MTDSVPDLMRTKEKDGQGTCYEKYFLKELQIPGYHQAKLPQIKKGKQQIIKKDPASNPAPPRQSDRDIVEVIRDLDR